MAIKTIEYEVDAFEITPRMEQNGGMQGDHRVTKIKFNLSKKLLELVNNDASGNKTVYRFDVYDGEGGVWSSKTETLSESVEMELEEKHTRQGGKITIYLVITILSNDNKTEMESYSFPAIIRFKNRPEGVSNDGGNLESISTIAEDVRENAKLSAESAKSALMYAQNADKTNCDIKNLASDIEAKLKNGEYDGVGIGGMQIVEGELIVTYTDGTVHNLGKIIGDNCGSALIDQCYNPQSANAQSGMAVSEAIDKTYADFQWKDATLEQLIRDYNEAMNNSVVELHNRITNVDTNFHSDDNQIKEITNNKKVSSFSAYKNKCVHLDWGSVYLIQSNTGEFDIDLKDGNTDSTIIDRKNEALPKSSTCLLFLPKEQCMDYHTSGEWVQSHRMCLFLGLTKKFSLAALDAMKTVQFQIKGNKTPYFTVPDTQNTFVVFKIGL